MCYTMDKHKLISSNNPRDLCIFTNEEIADFLTHNKKISDMFGILIWGWTMRNNKPLRQIDMKHNKCFLAQILMMDGCDYVDMVKIIN